MSAPANRIYFVSDCPILAESLTKIMEKDPTFVICGITQDFQSALTTIGKMRPNAVLLNISSRSSSVIAFTKKIRKAYPSIPCIVLAGDNDGQIALRAIRAGAIAYLSSRETLSNLAKALRCAFAGDLYLSPEIAQYMMLRSLTKPQPEKNEPPIEKLSDQEFEFFRLLGEGKSVLQVARVLHARLRNLRTYQTQVKNKLGLRNSTELILIAMRWCEKTAN